MLRDTLELGSETPIYTALIYFLMRDIFRNQYIQRAPQGVALVAEEKGSTTIDKRLFGINGHKCDDFI